MPGGESFVPRRRQSIFNIGGDGSGSEAGTARRSVLFGYFVCVLGALSYTPDGVLVRAASERADKWAVVFARSASYAVGMLLYTAASGNLRNLKQFTDIGWLFPIAGVIVGIYSLCFTLSVQYTSVANALVIIACSPLFGATLSFFILGEKPLLRTIVATLVCIACIAFIFAEELEAGDTESVFGMILATVTSSFLALYFVLVRKARQGCPTANMVPCAITGQLLNCLIAVCIGPKWESLDDLALLWTGLNGGVVLVLANAFLTVGATHIPATEVNLIMMIETVVGPVWVYLAGFEAPPAATLYGGSVLLVTLFIHGTLSIRDPQQAKAAVPGDVELGPKAEQQVSAAAMPARGVDVSLS